MIFSSSIFIFAFLPICLAIYYWIPRNEIKIKNVFLFIMSLAFYAWGEPLYVFIMLASIILNYIFGILIENYRENAVISKLVIVIMLMVNLSIIFVFKYSGFFVSSINNLFALNFSVPKIALPIGISFFTFEAISYVIDVYKKKDSNGEPIVAQRNIVNVGLYMSFFPHLVAGPIVRYNTIVQQINSRVENFDDFSEGVKRFIIGFSKKTLLANNLALISDKAFSMPNGELGISLAWLGAISYTLQIFFDFSGYSDMAIGLGKMFGFHFMENFNYPYISKSVSEFWRRWHISLSSWFRDYVYISLGGNRLGIKRTIFNSFVVWLLTGIWHGANWTFISWGIYYFIFISLEKLFESKFKVGVIKENRIYNFIKHFYVILVVTFGWVLFRANSMQEAVVYIKAMFNINNKELLDGITLLYLNQNKYFLIFAIIFSMPTISYLKNVYHKLIEKIILKRQINLLCNLVYSLLFILIFLVDISYVVKEAYSPFIYFNF